MLGLVSIVISTVAISLSSVIGGKEEEVLNVSEVEQVTEI